MYGRKVNKQITADPSKPEDYREVYDGVYELWGERDPKRTDNTGTLMAWAWGLCRGLDLAERIPEIDARKSVVTRGRSRRTLASCRSTTGMQRRRILFTNSARGGMSSSITRTPSPDQSFGGS